MNPQVLFPFLLPSLSGLSAASVIRSPASGDLSTLPENLGTRTTKSQTANYLSITAELGPPTRISTSILHQSVASESEEETPTSLVQGKKQAVQPPPGTATDPGAGSEQQPQQPDKPKITHDPLPTEATQPSSNGGGGPKSGKNRCYYRRRHWGHRWSLSVNMCIQGDKG